MAKTPLELAELMKLNPENRRATLNKRINYKGNYENYITGGSHALNNQASLHDSNATANTMVMPDHPGWKKEPWIQGLNDRYTNPQHNEKAGESPYGSGLNYIHRYTPSTKRGRRVSDIFFQAVKNGVAKSPLDLAEYQKLVNKYEGKK